MAALAFLWLVRSILLPFVLAFIISMLLDPTIKKLRKRGYSRTKAVWIVFILFFLTVTFAGILVVPLVASQISNFSSSIERFTTSLTEKDNNENFFVRWNPVVKAQPPGPTAQIDDMLEQYKGILEKLSIPPNRKQIVARYIAPYQAEIGRSIEGFFKSFLGIVAATASSVLMLLFVPLFVFLILIDMENFRIRSASWIPPSIRAQTLSLFRDIGEVFAQYLRGVTTTVAIYMVVMMIWLFLLGAPSFALLAVLFGVLYIIPYVGPAIACATLFLTTMISGQSSNWFMAFDSPWIFALVITLLYLMVSVGFDQLVYPRLVGKAVGLHPLVSMFVVFSGAALFGLIGMLIAFPLAGSIKVVLDRLLRITSGTVPASQETQVSSVQSATPGDA